MNEAALFLTQPLVALTVTQVVGMVILLAGLDNDNEIAARSATCYDYNPHVLKHLISNNYDQKTGLFIVTLPTIIQAMANAPFWSSYLCLLIGIILRFTPLRLYIISKRTKEVKLILDASGGDND